MNFTLYKAKLNDEGFAIVPNLYTPTEMDAIIEAIDNTDTSADTFRKSENLFAIRQFLKAVPDIVPLVFNNNLRQLINDIAGNNYFIVKSIYFDKPGDSNWFVAWHQDLTISVKEKNEAVGYGPWTVKQNQYAVQPPLGILENIITIRIHLDDTDDKNGALKVLPGSHRKGIYRPDTIDHTIDRERSCHVSSGGVMLMKPLIMHSSSRTVNNNRRRVIHIEFSNAEIPLKWAERENF